jgi:hypothetical protein
VVQHQWGYVGNVVLIGFLGSGAVLLLYATCRRWGVGELASVVLVLWAFGMSLGSFGVRPQTITRVLLALSVLVLTTYRQSRDWRVLVVFPPLFALWSNLHGGFAIGLGLLGLTLLGEGIEAARKRSWLCVRPIALTTVASVAATLINPNGLEGVLYPLAYIPQVTGGQQLISEWQPPDVRQPVFAPFALSVVLALALGLFRPPLRAVERLWGLAFAVLALQSVRNIQLYATVVMPLLGARLAYEMPAFRRTIAEWRRPRRMAVLWTIVALACAGVWFARFSEATDWHLQLGKQPSSAGYPVGGAAYLRDHDLKSNLFNQFEWGGYLIYANWPQQRVFIDGRPDMYGPDLFSQYVTVAELRPHWREILDSHDVRLALIDRDGPLAAELARDPEWRELYVGPVERLLERVSTPPSTLPPGRFYHPPERGP